MQAPLIKKMQPYAMHTILAYFELLLNLRLISDKAHIKAKDRVLDLIVNNL